jgi:hypothetical protein
MFCPECRAEYRPGFTHCSDCEVDLVHELSESDTRARQLRRDWMSMFPTIKRMYGDGPQDCSLVGRIETPNGHLALVFNHSPFHEWGCDFVRGGVSHLVERRTPFVALGILGHFFAGIVTRTPFSRIGQREESN